MEISYRERVKKEKKYPLLFFPFLFLPLFFFFFFFYTLAFAGTK